KEPIQPPADAAISGRKIQSCPMSEISEATEDYDAPGFYEVRLKGHLDDRWADWFEGLTLTLENDGTTLLQGPVVDQAALYGLLKKVRDLGISLISVNRVEPDQVNASDAYKIQ
ncbi:MAG: hypothetical protein ACRDEA_23910, partial [Microcystaceae cyanobacterium]